MSRLFHTINLFRQSPKDSKERPIKGAFVNYLPISMKVARKDLQRPFGTWGGNGERILGGYSVSNFSWIPLRVQHVSGDICYQLFLSLILCKKLHDCLRFVKGIVLSFYDPENNGSAYEGSAGGSLFRWLLITLLPPPPLEGDAPSLIWCQLTCRAGRSITCSAFDQLMHSTGRQIKMHVLTLISLRSESKL